MNGILVINHFLRTDKFDELHSHLVNTAEKMNISLDIKTNLQLSAEKKTDTDFVLFWDKDINLAKRLEKQGLPVFNSSDSIAKCDDKARTYIELEGIVPQPETLIAPKCYFKSDMTEFVDRAVEILGLPLVFKECFGSFGAQVYLCNSQADILSKITEKPFILQKFIKESSGKDKRLEIVDGRCVSAVMRENKNDFRSNVTNGGKMTACTPSDKEIQTAVKACEKLGLTFGGVDILENGDVCEVNSNAHIINIMDTSGVDVAPFIFEGIEKRILK
ncbi:MAG: RimK family alpha-L-glutamate ligase [Eubacterium sp.]